VKSSFRATTVHDLDAIRTFLGEIFEVGPGAAFLNPAMLNWKYWESRGDWDGPRSYVLEQDGKIAAHIGLWPLAAGSGSNSLQGAQLIDWGASRQPSGAGISLLMKLTHKFDFMIGIGGTDVARKILPAFGFEKRKEMWRGARPIRPFGQALTHQQRDWKLPLRFLRNTFWASQPSNSSFKQWEAREIGPQQIAPEIYSAAAAATGFAPRPPSFFEYLLRCPQVPFRLYGILERGVPKGHFSIGVLRGQARIAGVWLIEPSPAAWAAAYRIATEAARAIPNANEIVAAGTDRASREGAAIAGFRIVKGPNVNVLNEKNRLTLPADFQVQLCDDDAAFLDIGKSSYVT
jgi:hypothetical protein